MSRFSTSGICNFDNAPKPAGPHYRPIKSNVQERNLHIGFYEVFLERTRNRYKWGFRLCNSECPWKGDRRVGFEPHSLMVPAAARTEAWPKSSHQSLSSAYCHPYPSSRRPVGCIINRVFGAVFTLELVFLLVFLVSTHVGLMIRSWFMCSLDLSFLPSQMVAEDSICKYLMC